MLISQEEVSAANTLLSYQPVFYILVLSSLILTGDLSGCRTGHERMFCEGAGEQCFTKVCGLSVSYLILLYFPSEPPAIPSRICKVD